MKFLIVVDMQNDFISGSLGSERAVSIVLPTAERIKEFDGTVIFTRDTHSENYLKTQEGRKLPVEHCIKDTYGWQICDELKPFAENVIDKDTFGSMDLPTLIKGIDSNIDEIEFCGLCTDICVISNAMIVKAAFPEVTVSVCENCCAGVTEESHKTALDAMRAVQIEIK